MLVLGDEEALADIAKGTSRSQVHDYAVLWSMLPDNNESDDGMCVNWWVKLTEVKWSLSGRCKMSVGGGKESRCSKSSRTGRRLYL
jgi:hypothetical protein